MPRPFSPEVPVFAYPVNWSKGVLERYEWLTRVLTSQVGDEQRQSLRLHPRRSLEFTVYLSGAQRMRMDAYLSTRPEALEDEEQRGLIYCPIWPQQYVLQQNASNGAAIDIAERDFYEFHVGGPALLYDPQTRLSSVVEVSALGTDTLTLSMSGSYQAGCLIVPLRLARFSDKPRFTKLHDRLYEGRVRFSYWETDDTRVLELVALLGTVPNYRGVYAMTQAPRSSEDMTVEYERLYSTLDNARARPIYTELSEKTFSVVQITSDLIGLNDYRLALTQAYYLAGRLRPLWIPTFMQDIEPVADVDNDTDIKVKACGLVDFNLPAEDRVYLRFEFAGGVLDYATVTGVSADGDFEVITISQEISLPVALLRKISFMVLMRQDQDGVEFQHTTDITGVTSVMTTFRSTRPRVGDLGAEVSAGIGVPLP